MCQIETDDVHKVLLMAIDFLDVQRWEYSNYPQKEDIDAIEAVALESGAYDETIYEGIKALRKMTT